VAFCKGADEMMFESDQGEDSALCDYYTTDVGSEPAPPG